MKNLWLERRDFLLDNLLTTDGKGKRWKERALASLLLRDVLAALLCGYIIGKLL